MENESQEDGEKNNGEVGAILVQRSLLCRSRRELSNAYLLAKFAFQTESKACVTTSNFAAKARLLASNVNSAKNRKREKVLIRGCKGL